MTNAGKSPQASQSGSLDHQIDATERRLALRYCESTAHAAALKAGIRKKLSSPRALLLATGVGFALGQIRTKREKKPVAERTEISANRFFTPTGLLQMVSLAGSVMALWTRYQNDKTGV
jgi:hypothetical protein